MPLHFNTVPSTFIHIPKNAGNSLEEWAIKNQVPFEDKFNHCTLEQAQQLWPTLGTVFSFVRNPYSRVVSMFHYHGQHAEKRILSKQSIDIIDDIKTLTFYKKGFDYWLNALHDLNSDFNEKDGIGENNGQWPRRATQTSWFSGQEIDLVIKVEELKEKFHLVEELLNCKSQYPLEVVNPSVHRPYQEYYTNQSKKIIREMFADDLNKFNYDF